MSEEGKRYPRALALEAARDLCRALKPVTARLIVAGSLRRMLDEVGDVDIVYIPQFENRPVDMFERGDFDLAGELLDRMLAEGILSKRQDADGRTTWGDRNKFAIHKATGMPVDFFRTSEESFANYVVCRTGSVESNKRIANAALAKGLRWLPYGSGFMDHYDRLIRVEKEEDAFTLVGLPYLEPKDR